MPAVRRSLFPPFAGVALADILANSVAIVIIMIVVTLMSRYEQEQDKLEQADDVAVLLSRELATSFVMNALPTSPPARLHDYVTSPLDQNPLRSRMPILEMHEDHLRDYYTGEVYPRDELLRRDNALDAYLASLTPEQLAALRLDIYSIKQFYVAMSIFRSHGHQPRHWHFLAGVPDAAGGAPVHVAGRMRRGAATELGGLGGAGGEDGAPASGGALPQDVAPALAGGGFGGYPDDARAFAEAGGDGALPEYPGLPGEAPAQGGTPGGARPAPAAEATTRTFRAAASGSLADLAADLRVDMYTILRALFAYMAEVQEAADAGLPSPLPRYDFRRDALGLLAELPPPTAEEDSRLRSLAFALDAPRPPSDPALGLVHRTRPDVRGQALAMFANVPLGRVLWLADAEQPPPGTDSARVSLRLGVHAEIYEGLRVPLARDSVLLAAQHGDERPRWRVVTLVNPARSDFLTGFLYAARDEAGRLLLPVDENGVDIGGLRVESHLPSVPLRGERLALVFYAAIAALFVVGLVRRYWSPAKA